MRSFIVCCLVTSAGAAAPAPKVQPATYYFPTKVGDKRVYEITTGKDVVEATDVVTKVEETTGRVTVTLVRKEGDRETTVLTEVTAKSVERQVTAPMKAAVLRPVIKLPARAGDTWVWQPEGEAGGKETCTVAEPEEIAVPAGRFKAVRLTNVQSLGGLEIKSTHWHAAGVGLVRMESGDGDAKRVQVLKAFTPAK